MKMPAFVRLTMRNIVVNIDPGTLIFMLGLPTLYLFVMGFMFQGINPNGGLSVVYHGIPVKYTTFLAPGIIALQAFTAGNVGGSMLWSDRRWGMFEQIMVGPFRRSEYLLGIIFVSILFSLIGSAIMIGFAFTIPVQFNISLAGIGLFILTMIVGTMLFSSLFLIISGIAKSMQAYNTITILLFFLLDFASTAFYPITNSTPEWLRVVAGVNPLSFISDILRNSFISGVDSSSLYYSGILLLAMLIFFGISLRIYKNIRSGI
jgi:ABC-2 type transport system permease protein